MIFCGLLTVLLLLVALLGMCGECLHWKRKAESYRSDMLWFRDLYHREQDRANPVKEKVTQ